MNKLTEEDYSIKLWNEAVKDPALSTYRNYNKALEPLKDDSIAKFAWREAWLSRLVRAKEFVI